MELGNAGYLISVYEGKADIKVDGIEIEIDDIGKQMGYVDAGVDVSICGNANLTLKSC